MYDSCHGTGSRTDLGLFPGLIPKLGIGTDLQIDQFPQFSLKLTINNLNKSKSLLHTL